MQEFDPHVLDEKPIPPPEEFSKKAHVKSLEEYRELYAEAKADPEAYWAEQGQLIEWAEPPKKTLEWNPPHAKWFVGGKLNVSYNCLDRHLEKNGNKPALMWEAEDGSTLQLTYAELFERVCKFANVLQGLGVKAGDCVAIYMPMIPEIAVALLASARIGAVHSVVFGGFSANAVKDRIEDAGAKMVITADGGWRAGHAVELKRAVDKALAEGCESVQDVIVYRRTGAACEMQPGRDVWWHDVLSGQSNSCAPEWVDAEHPLFLLYTSGSTGKPKGIQHSSAGYLLNAKLTTKWTFDLKDSDVFWCTADVGWITGHTYVVYGPLAAGATLLMYEGAPTFPDGGRFWKICETHGVTIFYTAPTAIRALMKLGEAVPLTGKKGGTRALQGLAPVSLFCPADASANHHH